MLPEGLLGGAEVKGVTKVWRGLLQHRAAYSPGTALTLHRSLGETSGSGNEAARAAGEGGWGKMRSVAVN